MNAKMPPKRTRGKMPPPKKRLCKEHRRPILRQRWWSGYRTKGCASCFEVPEPDDRLCRKHDAIQPVRGSEAVTRRDAVGVSTVALAIPLPKRDARRGQNCGFTEPSAKSN